MDQYSREFIAEKARLRPEDLGLVRTARRSHNQLGLAYQIAFIRLTGRAPEPASAPGRAHFSRIRRQFARRAGAKRPTRFGVRKRFYEEIRYGQFIRRHRWHR